MARRLVSPGNEAVNTSECAQMPANHSAVSARTAITGTVPSAPAIAPHGTPETSGSPPTVRATVSANDRTIFVAWTAMRRGDGALGRPPTTNASAVTTYSPLFGLLIPGGNADSGRMRWR
jgi:hypothetical protein